MSKYYWYIGSMNDALFIIDAPPRPSTDEINPNQDCNPISAAIDARNAQLIVDAHNKMVDRIARNARGML